MIRLYYITITTHTSSIYIIHKLDSDKKLRYKLFYCCCCCTIIILAPYRTLSSVILFLPLPFMLLLLFICLAIFIKKRISSTVSRCVQYEVGFSVDSVNIHSRTYIDCFVQKKKENHYP